MIWDRRVGFILIKISNALILFRILFARVQEVIFIAKSDDLFFENILGIDKVVVG